MDKTQKSVVEYLQQIEKRQQNIENMLLSQKNVLTFDEATRYMGVTDSCLYKFTMVRTVPHYKPRGKMIYFDRIELEKWLLQNRVATVDEIEAKATTYVTLNKKQGRR